MAAASLLPEHLWRNKQGVFEPEQVRGNCFLIVNQSVRWGMDPFAVMPETYVVGGKLAYQGKLIAAVVNARAGLEGRLKYEFKGKKGSDDFTITVSGKFPGDEEASELSLSVGEAKTGNDMWRKDPEQKLVYSGAVKWARRYCPEIVLGVVTDDDIERMNERAAAEEKTVKQKARPVFTEPQPEGPAPVVAEENTLEPKEQKPEPAPEKKEPVFVPANAREKLAVALRDLDFSQERFVSGLRRIDPGKVADGITIVPQLPEEVCERVLEEGLDEILDFIRIKEAKDEDRAGK
ncbi:hypothetical protein [Terrimicrobium sacchariphilum]|nr:hypothetical protein [Terrimicrobium sacchariphilum]